MAAGLASLLPGAAAPCRPALLCLASLQGPASGRLPWTRKKQSEGRAAQRCSLPSILPLILVLFAVHVYLAPIDGAFPMMMVNGIVLSGFVGKHYRLPLFIKAGIKRSGPLEPDLRQKRGLSDGA